MIQNLFAATIGLMVGVLLFVMPEPKGRNGLGASLIMLLIAVLCGLLFDSARLQAILLVLPPVDVYTAGFVGLSYGIALRTVVDLVRKRLGIGSSKT